MRQLLLDLAPLPAASLDNFAVGRNAEPLRALRTWWAGDGERILYLWGPPGSGKTHLLRGAAAAPRLHGAQTVLLAAGELGEDDRGIQTGTWLAIDDVQSASLAGQAALFTLLNRAAAGELKLLVAGAIAPAGLSLREDVRTRLAAALVLQLHPLDDAEKERALQSHARSRGFELPAEAARHLLQHGRRDLRWLLSVLDALDRYSLQARRPITLSLAREVLQAAHAGGAANAEE